MKNFLILAVCMLTVITANAQTSGECGDNLTWELSADGTLTISGTGAVPRAFDYFAEPAKSTKKLVIGEGITSIDPWVFCYYYSLTSVSFPSTLETIGSNAFFFCTGITYVTIPASVTSIGEAAFSSCKNLTGFAIETGNTSYRSIDGVLFDAERTKLLCYPIGKPETTYTVPDGVRHIEAEAFSECTGLTSIFLPNSLETIGDGAFGYNPQLTSLVIPSSVTSIGKTAFWGCHGLSHITIPASVTSIGSQFIEYCTGLKSITVLWTEPSLINVNPIDPLNRLTKSEIRLYVPAGTEAKYRSIGEWKDFDIKEGSENNHPVLSSLNVSRGSLYPAFTQSCTSYRVSVGNSVSSITLSAAPYPLTATVSGAGEKALAPGENTFHVTVTSESGETQTYTLNVFRLPGEYALTADGYANRTVYTTLDAGKFDVIYGRYMYYILETFNVSGDLPFRFDFGNGIACDRTIAAQPNNRYKITLDLSTSPSTNGIITIYTPYDIYGKPGTPYIEYPYHDYLLSVSEGSNLLWATPVTFPGTLTAASVSAVLDGSSSSAINSAENGLPQVYPNPATDYIRLAGISGEANIMVYGVSGQLLLARNITGDEVVSISHLPAGLYFIVMQAGGNVLTSKFIKK